MKAIKCWLKVFINCKFFVFVVDFEHVISHHIQHDDFMAALDVLTKQVGELLCGPQEFYLDPLFKKMLS